jgi:glutamine synthetase
VEYELYAKEINIEAKTMIDIAGKQIIPAVIKYATELGTSINTIKAACDADVSVQSELLMEVSDLLADTKAGLARLQDVVEEGCTMTENEARARYYHDVVFQAMEELRSPVDKLEMLVDKEAWPMPSYGDLIFEV